MIFSTKHHFFRDNLTKTWKMECTSFKMGVFKKGVFKPQGLNSVSVLTYKTTKFVGAVSVVLNEVMDVFSHDFYHRC